MEVRLSDAEKVFIMHGVQEGLRNDGRSCSDYRPVFIERGVLMTTDGSARVRIGSSDVLVGVKCELVECDDSSKEKERLIFNVDCSANATPQFQGKGGDEYATELAGALSISFNNPLAIPDLEKLAVSGNHYWKIYVDVVVLQYGGSMVDAASIGAKVALYDTEICTLKARAADAKKSVVDVVEGEESWSLDVSRAPLLVCVSKVGTANVVDVMMEEEACSFASLWVGVLPPVKNSEALVSMCRQTGGGSLDSSSIEEMLHLAVATASKAAAELNEFCASSERGVPGETFLL